MITDMQELMITLVSGVQSVKDMSNAYLFECECMNRSINTSLADKKVVIYDGDMVFRQLYI